MGSLGCKLRLGFALRWPPALRGKPPVREEQERWQGTRGQHGEVEEAAARIERGRGTPRGRSTPCQARQAEGRARALAALARRRRRQRAAHWVPALSALRRRSPCPPATAAAAAAATPPTAVELGEVGAGASHLMLPMVLIHGCCWWWACAWPPLWRTATGGGEDAAAASASALAEGAKKEEAAARAAPPPAGGEDCPGSGPRLGSVPPCGAMASLRIWCSVEITISWFCRDGGRGAKVRLGSGLAAR